MDREKTDKTQETAGLDYQEDFSSRYSEMYNLDSRTLKARKVLAVVKDYIKADLNTSAVLDLGCSTGIITSIIALEAGFVVGSDIDRDAILFAHCSFNSLNTEFIIGDAMLFGFQDETFDVVICAHVYEHVPDARRMMKEIHRILKRGGVCYFAAGNRIQFLEPHYRLPFLSILPKPIAHIYLRIFRKGTNYYETHFFEWELADLIRPFRIIDYTERIIAHPNLFHAEEMIQPNTLKHRVAQFIVKRLYWLVPTYIWILEKQ